MSYQVIARKYRPQKFSDVVGQQAIVTTLKNSLAQGRTAHAYLFCGSRGTGKTTLARLLAKALNCDKKKSDHEPCNECPSCQAITAGRSLDVLEIDGASNRGIDDIRQINETVSYASSAGKWKIYIIDEVHMLTKEAFNALLKTLEEPPAGVKFFFATTEPEKVLETIISRCQRFDLSRIGEEEVIAKLKNICSDFGRTIEYSALRLIANRSGGSLRDAESMLDQILSFTDGPIDADCVAKHLGLPSLRFFFALDEHCAKENLPFALHLTEELFETGCDPILFLEGLAEHYRLLLLLTYDQRQIENRQYAWLEASIKKTYLHSVSLYTTEQCLFILEEIIHWLQKIGKSPYPRLVLEILLTTILRSRQRVSIDALIHRLSLLEKNLEDLPNKASLDLSDKQSSQIEPKVQKERPIPEIPKKEPPALPSQAPPVLEEPLKQNSQNLKEHSPVKTPERSSQYETIMRFAAVELEGSIKKPLT